MGEPVELDAQGGDGQLWADLMAIIGQVWGSGAHFVMLVLRMLPMG
jgi:hypothetical protein